MAFVKSTVMRRISLPAYRIGTIAAILSLGLQLTACHLPSWQTGQLRVATRFASREIQSQSLRIQAIPAESSAITVAVFRLGSQGKPEQSALLTPEHANHELGQLEPGPRRVLALAFNSKGQLLAGSSGKAQVLAGQTSQLSLELSSSFRPDAQELANLRALLPTPELTGSQASQQSQASTPEGQPASSLPGKTGASPANGPGTASNSAPSPAPLPTGPSSGNPLEAATGPIRESAGTVIDPATQTVDTLVDQVSGTVGTIANPVTNTVGSTVGTVSETVNQTADHATGTVNDTVDTVTGTVDQVGGSVGGPVAEVVDDVTDTVDETVDDTLDTVDDTVDAVASAVPSILPSLIPSILPTPKPTPTPAPTATPKPTPTATPKPSPTPLLGIKLPLG